MAVFPEGTISRDLDPMAGKTGAARLARATGRDRRARGPVGGSPPDHSRPAPVLAMGVAITRRGGGAVRDRTRRESPPGHRPDHGGDLRPGGPGPRHLPPAPEPGRPDWWVRPPEAARLRSCRGRVAQALLDEGVGAMRVAVIGAGSWGTTVAALATQNASSVVLWARRPELAAAIDSSHENPDYLPGRMLPAFVAGHLRPGRGADRSRSRGAGGSLPRPAGSAGGSPGFGARRGARGQPGQGAGTGTLSA